MHHVYIVRCADGTLYTGYARDVEARLAAHNAGRGARYTSGRRPVTLVYCERRRTKGAALSREHAIKQLSRAGKDALVARGAIDVPQKKNAARPRGDARRSNRTA